MSDTLNRFLLHNIETTAEACWKLVAGHWKTCFGVPTQSEWFSTIVHQIDDACMTKVDVHIALLQPHKKIPVDFGFDLSRTPSGEYWVAGLCLLVDEEVFIEEVVQVVKEEEEPLDADHDSDPVSELEPPTQKGLCTVGCQSLIVRVVPPWVHKTNTSAAGSSTPMHEYGIDERPGLFDVPNLRLLGAEGRGICRPVDSL